MCLCLVLSVFTVVPFAASAAEVTAEAVGASSGTTGNCTWTLNNGALTISGNGAMGDYSSYSSLPWGSNIKTVIIENGVTSIGDNAFFGCTGLTSITIPHSVTSIGGYVFYGCTGLKSITIPNSATSIGESAFYGCTGLTSITIPNSVTSIGYYAFEGCTGLKSVILSNGVMCIGYHMFYDCTSLTSVTIPNSVTSIDEGAFCWCDDLANVTIPENVTSIGSSAFYGTTWYYNQPQGLVYAGKVAYKYKGTMPSNTSIVLQDGTKGIADTAFNGCTGLTSVTIPDSVTRIGREAFKGCTSLTSVTIPDSVTSFGYDAFYNTAWYNSQSNGLVYADKVAYKYKGTMPSDTSIVLQNGTKVIADYSFSDCIGLTSITIPNGVTIIGDYAFCGCDGLTSVTIPDSVTSIGDLAFCWCDGLTSVTIPNSVTSIGDTAFSGNTELTIYGYIGSFAETYSKNNHIAFIALDDSYTYTDETTDISVTADADLTLRIIEKENTEIGDIILNNGEEISKAFDITLLKDGAETQPDGTVTVKIPCDDSNAKVYRVESDNTLTDMNAVYENGYLVFTTEHFSVYIVTVQKTVAIGDADLDGKIDIRDVTAIQRHIAEFAVFSDEQLAVADTNGDGVVTIDDATHLQRYLAEYDVQLG